MTIDALKKQFDIIDIAERYTDLKKSGDRYYAKENPIREENTSSLYFYADTQKFKDFGSGEHGDLIDFVKRVENLNSLEEVESFLLVNHKPSEVRHRTLNKPKKKDNELLLKEVEIKANKYLSASPYKVICKKKRLVQKWNPFMLEFEDEGGTFSKEVVSVAPIFEKLFEGNIHPTDPKFAKYLFDKVIGYNEYFDCPVIVVRDESETPVNIISYRPSRDGEPLMQGSKPLKYLNLRSEEVPDSNYIFPLQAQMMKIVKKTGACYVGEGLKNAINASLYGIPFISIESAGNIKPELIDFLLSDRMNGIRLIGAFDGDSAGKKAYETMTDHIPMENRFDFDSGIDFADYVKKERLCLLKMI